MKAMFYLLVWMLPALSHAGLIVSGQDCRKCQQAQNSGYAICNGQPNARDRNFYDPGDREKAGRVYGETKFAGESFEHAEKMPASAGQPAKHRAAMDAGRRYQSINSYASKECGSARTRAERVCQESRCECAECNDFKEKSENLAKSSAAWGTYADGYQATAMSEEDARKQVEQANRELSDLTNQLSPDPSRAPAAASPAAAPCACSGFSDCIAKCSRPSENIEDRR